MKNAVERAIKTEIDTNKIFKKKKKEWANSDPTT